MKNLMARYVNGNYHVKIYDDGTKIRFGPADVLVSEFPENIDIKITDYCDAGCAFCHENSTKEGKHGDILNLPFLGSLRPGTELAIGGGNPLDHPDLDEFLKRLKSRGIISNLTVNSKHILENFDRLKMYMDTGLIHGLGISVNSFNAFAFSLAKTYNNVVLHMINGVITEAGVRAYRDPQVKVLFLGYKMFRRGIDAHSSRTERIKGDIYDSLEEILRMFHTVSFDNLGIEQLKPQRFMTEQEWSTFYMGDDGQYTMYIDMVKRQFARNSTAEKRYDLKLDIVDMFSEVKKEDDLEYELSRASS